MKNYIYFLLLICLVSCAANYRSSSCSYDYSIRKYNDIPVDRTELETAVSSVLRQDKTGLYSIEIIIYGYSSGKELFSYAGDSSDNIEVRTRPGRLEALVKIRRNNDLQDAVFIKASGNSNKELVKNFSDEIRRIFCN